LDQVSFREVRRTTGSLPPVADTLEERHNPSSLHEVTATAGTWSHATSAAATTSSMKDEEVVAFCGAGIEEEVLLMTALKFTAEMGLYRSRNAYATVATRAVDAGGRAIVPQARVLGGARFPGAWFPGFALPYVCTPDNRACSCSGAGDCLRCGRDPAACGGKGSCTCNPETNACACV
jgi:hypothetical protein